MFFEIKNIYFDTLWLCRQVSDKKNVHLADFQKQDYFFLA